MGKSGGKRKKSASAVGDGGTKLDSDDTAFLKRAHELKDEGNKRFQAKEYAAALEKYEQALKLAPEGHPDRAVFHSNRAACLMQMKPTQYESVIMECTLALEAHPKYSRALLRRARAYESSGKLQLALSDIQLLLQAEPNNHDALELGKRLRAALGNKEGAQQDTQSHSRTLTASPPDEGTSPGTPRADDSTTIQGVGRGPSLAAKPLGKKKGWQVSLGGGTEPRTASHLSAGFMNEVGTKADQQVSLSEQSENKSVKQKVNAVNGGKVSDGKHTGIIGEDRVPTKCDMRPLKFIYGHDIRRAEIPVNCSFGELRNRVKKTYPSSKAVLIKYRDEEGDLVTITNRLELRMAEIARGEEEIGREKLESIANDPVGDVDSTSSVSGKHMVAQDAFNARPKLLRLHVVEVDSEQEPPVPDNDDEVEVEETPEKLSKDVDSEVVERGGMEASKESLEKNTDEKVTQEITSNGDNMEPKDRVKNEDGQLVGEEMEIDDWLFDFAQLFRSHVGIDPDGHVDFHELGMELCSEALEAVVSSEEAQPLFEAAASKFQEVAALAFFNWGNVYMCAARKRIPVEAVTGKTEEKEQFQAAYDWAQSHYKLAGQKYEEALRIKPDFYEGVLALGQEKFESAKLQWAAAVASGVDLKIWSSSETLGLFTMAEERMQTAAEMWEQLEAQQAAQGEHPLKGRSNRELVKLEVNPDDNAPGGAEAVDQSSAMRSQINLFWGNVLFEHSQVEYRLDLKSWRKLLDVAVEKFELAGASPEDISEALKNHPSNNVDSDAANVNKGEVDKASELLVQEDSQKVTEESK
ncbi:hypothetical protein CY35_18G039800 [Sphagnum magellanicum]|nr:hypothetical protein CY35_18G039800 [Sphagnum magellanicum]